MKRKNIISTLLSVFSVALFGGLLQSCEDYLTVYPTDQITEEEFWQDKNDVENVRAAAYQNLTKSGLTSKILQWGEYRSDNLTLYTMSNTSIMHMQNGVLMPTETMFDWAGFYTGINYCNLILEKGQKMVDDGVDPSFSDGDWRPIKAEMMALRALYYFYLVRAFRDVPYVSEAVTTDEQAMRSSVPATPGVAILGDLIDSLEVCKSYAATNFGSSTDNKGRFTKRSVRTLLADMYLWRGCLLKNFQSKKDNYSQIVNLDDVVGDTASVDSTSSAIHTADGTVVNKAYTDALAKECFNQAYQNASWVLDDMKAEYDEDMADDNTASSEAKNQKYPMILITTSNSGTPDKVYNEIFGNKNSSESIFELQFDGTNNVNSTLSTFSYMSSGALATGSMVANSAFVNLGTIDPSKGFGKTDVRLLETMKYEESGTSSSYPILKGVASNIQIISQNAEDMSEGANYNFRNTQNGNWPIYRLSDLMLIKAEAAARYYAGQSLNETLYDAFDMVNSIFMRCNPALRPTTDNTAGENVSSRLNGIYGANYDHTSADYYVKKESKSVADLLTLIYQERQREFVGEGKFWFDLVREAEATNDPTTALTSYMSLTSSVKNKLKQIYSLYNPVYNEEIKVNTQLIQNPIWERYSK